MREVMTLTAQRRYVVLYTYYNYFGGHNLCCERPISKLKEAFSSCLVVLQNGALRSILSSKKKNYAWAIKWVFFQNQAITCVRNVQFQS